MKKIDIRDIRSEEILAVNRGENTLFQRRETKGSFQKISSVTAKICLLPESPFLPGLLLTVVYQRKQPIL